MAATPTSASEPLTESLTPQATAYERVRLYARQLEHSQQELSQQTNVLNSVLESISDGVVVADREGRFLRFNVAAQHILGIGLTQGAIDEWPALYGCYLPDGVTPHPPHELPLARAIRGETVNEAEIFIRNAQKTHGVWISVNASPLRDRDGNLIGGVAAFRDITARKRMDEKLKATAAELARSNQDLEQFAYVVSHDLQKPLRKLSSFCKLLEDGQRRRRTDGEAAQLLGFIVDSAARMENLIGDVLRYARAGRGGTGTALVDLNAVFRQALDDCALAPDRQTAIAFDELPTVQGDATQLGQLALNLLDNALKYQPTPNPWVQVTAERQGNAWLLAVRDHGIGIEADALTRIFESFERAHPEGPYPGTGLGLAICKRIVENHGGRIWAESQPGQGTTFFFTLPDAHVAELSAMTHDAFATDDHDEPAPVRAGEELSLTTLEPYLRRHLTLVQAPLQLLQFPHGHSNLTYLVRCGADEWVLRRPPFGNQVKTAHDMAREFRILSRLCDLYPAAPRPLHYCDDTAILGVPFYLMERRRGRIVRKRLPDDLQRQPDTLARMSAALVDRLADLHALDIRRPELAELGKPEGYALRQVQGWIRRYGDAETERIEAMDALTAWLPGHVPDRHGACVVHNDYKFDNVLFDPADPLTIVAVLDWEMATLGDPLMDLGTTLGYWVQSDDLEELRATAMGPTMAPGCLTRLQVVQRYAARTGRDIGDLAFYQAFGLFKIAVIIQQIYARFVRGHTNDPRFAGMSSRVSALARQGTRVIEGGFS